MNKASFLTLVRQASRISDQDVEELEKLVVNFPYCQTAHLLLAKAAYDKGSMLSNQKLKKAAIYAANRQLLKKLIYTSDATVSLQPVEAPETVTETQEKVAEAFSEPENQAQTIAPEAEALASFTHEIPAETTSSEIISEPDHEDAAIAGEILLEETKAILAKGYETTPETIPAPVHEATVISEELPDEGILPETAAFAVSETQYTDATFIQEAETPGFEAEKPADETSEVSLEIETENEAEETVGFEAEKVTEAVIPAEEIPIATEAEVSETLAETEEKQEELTALAAHTLEDVPDLHELFLENAPEVLVPAETKPAEIVTHLNDDLLHETLASFDQYLFKPEKELEETTEEDEDLKVVYPENVIQNIYDKDSIGYWMNSSRMGECLEFKNELTTSQPYEFRPELIWEYGKTHELQKEIKPAASKLSKQLEIIDEFLKMTPRLKTMASAKIKTETQEDLSSKSSKINKNLASENFANILVQQGKIKKAIKIYEHLILKIPEKKPYFVSQIEKLQNLE